MLVEVLNDSDVALALNEVGVVCESGLELVELVFADRLHLLNHAPLDALSARRGSEGSVVALVVGHVDGA